MLNFEIFSIFGGNIGFSEIEEIFHGVDGVILVFDSNISCLNENLTALKNIIKISKGRLIKKIPLITMLNFEFWW